MSGGGGSPQTTTQKVEPWEAQKQYLQFGFDEARKAYDSGAPKYFPGQTLADIDPAQTAALDFTEQRAMAGNPLNPMAQGQAFDTLGGAYLGAGNPFRDAMVERIKADVMPGIDATFAAAGRSGSGLHGRAIGEGLGDAIAAADYGMYENERARQFGAMQLAPQLAEADYADFAHLGQAGDARRSLEQGLIADDMQRYNYEQNLPWMRLANYQQLVQGNFGQSNTVTQPTQRGSLAAGALGGAASGAAAGSMIMPGWGTAIGAVGGGLLGALGSR